MGQRPIDKDLKQEIWKLVENDPKLSAGRILIALGKKMRPDQALPNERSIQRIKKAFLQRPKNERLPYHCFSWPASMLDGSLPWEASKTLCELELYTHENGFSESTIREAEWYWRLTLAAPDMGIKERHILAYRCADKEAVATSLDWLGVREYIAHAPWRSRKARVAYEKALHDGVPPLPKASKPMLKIMNVSVMTVAEEQKLLKQRQGGRKR